MAKSIASATGKLSCDMTRAIVLAVILAVQVILWPVLSVAQELKFFRIGTGNISGTLFAVGSTIASVISNPPGSRACKRGGSCGVPNLVAVAQSTDGAIANAEAISLGLIESALVRADVAYWAYHGTGPFNGKPAYDKLRAIANLYPAVVHIVARGGQGIFKVSDLADKRVSLGPRASGISGDAQVILEAYGLVLDEIEAVYLQVGEAADDLEAGEIDAFFDVDGVPVKAIAGLATRTPTVLLPIEGAPRDQITNSYSFLTPGEINSGTYDWVAYTPTVAVSMQLVVSSDADEELIYQITNALWHKRSRDLLETGHLQGRHILLENALDGISIPLHPGAARFYREQGLQQQEP